MPRSLPEPQSPNTSADADIPNERAKMLVSLLGADFARKSDHPFFRKLAKAAQNKGPGTVKGAKKNPKLGSSLTALVKALEDAEAGKTKPVTAARKAQKPQAKSQKKPVEQKKPEPEERPKPATDNIADLLDQHPALIARKLVDQPSSATSKVLKLLPGYKARQVTILLSEFKRRK